MGTDDLFKKKKKIRERRTIGTKKMASDRFLIVCEGTKTEPNYFNYFKKKIREANKDSVNVEVHGKGMNTLSLVNETINLKNASIIDYSQVWCVFDKDDFKDESFNTACQKAQDNNIEIAYSNESFELWYILHFNLHQSQSHRGEYIRILKDILETYEKNDPNIVDKIYKKGGSVDRAIAYAKKLDDDSSHLPFSQRNPSTNLYKLVEELKKFI